MAQYHCPLSVYYTVLYCIAYCIRLTANCNPNHSDSQLLYVTHYLSSITPVLHLMTHSMPCAGSANKTTLAPLVVQQKKAIRIISKAKYRDHTAPLFSKLEILPLEQLILYNRLKFMHNYYFRKLPFSFHNLWLTNAERNPVHELRNVNDYFIPPHRIELVKRMPLFSFPAAWNSETDEKFITSQPVYLKSLRKRLLATLNV